MPSYKLLKSNLARQRRGRTGERERTRDNEIDDSLGRSDLGRNLHGGRKVCSLVETLTSVHDAQGHEIETSNKTPNQVDEHVRLVRSV